MCSRNRLRSDRLGDLYGGMREAFAAEGFETADRDARLILQNHTGLEWADLIMRPDTAIPKEQCESIFKDMQRRLQGEPVSRILGCREFWGLDFKLSAQTLDPRPDTETLVEAALHRFSKEPPQKILDLGTGSGCILISLLCEWPQAQGVGIDLSFGALEVARRNAQDHGLGNRAAFACGAWGESLEGGFDLIVGNPPYIANDIIPTLAREVRNHDPILALDGGDDGLQAYKDIFSDLLRLLKKGGVALFEIGFDQEKSVMRLAEESGFCVQGVHRDLAGQPRTLEISSGDK